MIWTALAIAAPLSVSTPASIRADGRTVVPVELSGGPESLEGEHPQLADEGTVSCDGAAAIAAHGQAARLLFHGSAQAREIACKAHRRGAETSFSLRAEPPGPGLYASLDRELAFSAFRILPDGSAVPARSLRVGVSTGQLTGGRVVLPPGRAPRAVAVALVDAQGEGAAFLPVPGRTQLHLESKRGAMLSVRIAGALFGPLRAPAGKVTLPVWVPPGVRQGVVRAVDRLGNARELPIDLSTPDLPRIAAVLQSAQVVAGEEARLAIAVAGADGAPAETAPRAEAQRGKISLPTAQGAGLWVARYRAALTPGRDVIRVEVPNDSAAGRVELAVEVVPGAPMEISLAPPGPVRAGEQLTVRASVRDAAGNPLVGIPLEASLAGAPARVSWDGAIASVVAKAPERSAPVELAVRTPGAANGAMRLEVLPAEASSAEMTAHSEQRLARVHALVRDRFGNPLGSSGFSLLARGASVGVLEPDSSGAAEATLLADPRARSADAEITAAGRVLARTHVRFDPPADAWLMFAGAAAAAMSNGGALRTVRPALQVGLRRRFGGIEGALLTGADAIWFRGAIDGNVAGQPVAVEQRLFALTIPLMARVRRPFARRWGIGAEVGPLATFAWASAASGVSGLERQTTLVPGFRARAFLDYNLGRSRILLGGGWGTARLPDSSPLRGEIEGRSVFLGYEAWWLDLGP
jgi:hypothetical protein